MTQVLAVDVGGSHVKLLASGEEERRRFESGPELTPERMVTGVRAAAEGWNWDVVSVGVPAPVKDNQVAAEPMNLGGGWLGFDFEQAFGKPTKLINDAAMQALGSYEGGKMLFLGLGTGLGTALVHDGEVDPMELAHLPYRKATFEDYVGERGLKKNGKKRWRKDVLDVIQRLTVAVGADYVVLGGGNAKLLNDLPDNVRLGSNANAFRGGFRLWDQ
jgi:polyphosphate glucokinase